MNRVSSVGAAVVYNALAYAARRVPEITDRSLNLDRAVRWGYSHDWGPFEIWDALGVRRTVVGWRRTISPSPMGESDAQYRHESFYRSTEGL